MMTIINEEWQEVKGFEGYYVSSIGNVMNKHGRILRCSQNKGGYKTVVLTRCKKQKRFMVHRLVAEAFLKREYGDIEVNHKNGIKTDNRVCNLEWCTKSENQKHRRYVLNKGNRAVKCVETGEIYNTIKEAAKTNSSYGPDITRACQNKSTAKGKHWEYI